MLINIDKDLESFLHQKYTVEGLSMKQIALRIFSSKEKVRSLLRRFKIPIRTVGVPKGKIPIFGQRRFKNRLVKHKHEQAVIDLIKQYREEGKPLRQICVLLIEANIPTKYKGVWHPEMIRRILRRI